MTIAEVRLQMQQMESHFYSGFSYLEQQFLERVNYTLFKKGISNKGCQDCYRDAFVIIRKTIKDMAELPQKSAYMLKAGVLLHKFGTSDFYILEMSEEAAENWLHENPDDITKFQRYPEDYKERIAARFASQSQQTTEDKETTAKVEKTQQTRKKRAKKASK